jgi:hypothetical protein
VTETIQQRLVRYANSCYFTVAVDANRKPLAVPPLVLTPGNRCASNKPSC